MAECIQICFRMRLNGIRNALDGFFRFLHEVCDDFDRHLLFKLLFCDGDDTFKLSLFQTLFFAMIKADFFRVFFQDTVVVFLVKC